MTSPSNHPMPERAYGAIRRFVTLLARQGAREFAAAPDRREWTHTPDAGAGSTIVLSTATSP